jgi:hypothetical protein
MTFERLRETLTSFGGILRAEFAREGPSFMQVRQMIADGRHAVLPALVAISRISTSIDRSHQTMQQVVIQTERGDQAVPVANWTLAFVAKELVYVGREDFKEPNSLGQIAFYSNWYTSIIDPRSILAIFSKTKRRRRAQSIMIRMDYEQIALQRLSPIAEIARTLILYQQLPATAHSSKYDPAREFLSLSGLSIIEFVATGFAAFTRAQQPASPSFVSGNLTPARVSAGLLAPENVAKFLSRAAADYSAIRENVDAEESNIPGYEKYALNPLFKTPIVRTHVLSAEGDPILVAPVPSLILYRVTHGIYWDLLNRWSSEVAARGRKNAPDFPSFFGRAFEQYVGDLLSEVVPASRLIPERKFGPPSRVRDSCDWIVLENGTAILIECKTSRFHKATKATGDPQEFLKEASDIYAKAIVQLLRTRQAIETGDLPLPSKPNRFLAMIVIFDHLLMATLHLKEDLRELVPHVDPAFSAEDVDAFEYRILPIRLLELFLTSIPREGVAGIFDPNTWDRVWDRGRGGYFLPRLLKAKFREFEETMRTAFEI